MIRSLPAIRRKTLSPSGRACRMRARQEHKVLNCEDGEMLWRGRRRGCRGSVLRRQVLEVLHLQLR
jgi:hypothetical protein